MTVFFALLIGFVLDLLFGDPPGMPHIVVGLGKIIALLEKVLRRLFPVSPRGERAAGVVLVLTVTAAAYGAIYALVWVVALAHPILALLVSGFLCYQTLAAKSLRDAGLAVYRELERGDLAGARRAVGRIVGRDTAELDTAGVVRATVETVAENTSDGVVAPMLYFAIGGAPLAVLYKAINTMDSMLGYKSDRYRDFGWAAARLDDVANFLPSRLTALVMIPAAAGCGLNWPNAYRIWRRDRFAHTSPNAGHPEAACAGALGIRLGGDSTYGGRLVNKPLLGDALRDIGPTAILQVCRLLYGCSVLSFELCLLTLLGWNIWREGRPLWM